MKHLPTFHSTTFTAIERDGEPWITSRDLASALGYSRPDSISRIHERNADEFTDSMTAILRIDQANPGRSHRQSDGVTPRNKQSDTRIFSLRGAHLVAMFAKTPIAAEFRRWVLDVLDRIATPDGHHNGDADEVERQARLWLNTRDQATPAELLRFLHIQPDTAGRAWAAQAMRDQGWQRVWVRGPRLMPAPARIARIAGDSA